MNKARNRESRQLLTYSSLRWWAAFNIQQPENMGRTGQYKDTHKPGREKNTVQIQNTEIQTISKVIILKQSKVKGREQEREPKHMIRAWSQWWDNSVLCEPASCIWILPLMSWISLRCTGSRTCENQEWHQANGVARNMAHIENNMTGNKWEARIRTWRDRAGSWHYCSGQQYNTLDRIPSHANYSGPDPITCKLQWRPRAPAHVHTSAD